MPKYIFLDTWVYSLLTNSQMERSLTAFLKDRGFTVLTTSLSMVELYNPLWETAGDKDRGLKVAQFLSQVPAVIVNPQRVWDTEVAAFLSPVQELPLELDLRALPSHSRTETLLQLLRRDRVFLKQDIDIQQWSDNYAKVKDEWLANVENIIDQACKDGNLKRDGNGTFVDLQECKEQFLFSLDFRHANPNDIDRILARRVELARSGVPTRLTAVRLSSLCFWYAYVHIDSANKMKRNGSDIGDFYHISLLPYCAAITTDGSMQRMLSRIREPIAPVQSEVITRKKLEGYLKSGGRVSS